MMIDPISFVKQYEDKKYAELLEVRDELIDSILAFEELPMDERSSGFEPAPEVIYQCNLEYLGKLCALIAEKYRTEIVWGEED